MCSRVLKGMLLLTALAAAMSVGAALGGGTVYLLTRDNDARPIVEIRTSNLDPWRGLPPGMPAPTWGTLLPTGGAMVLLVAEDSPAAQAGLREGDVITALDDEPVVGPGSLATMVAAREPGDKVELTVYRLGDRARSTIQVTLGEHPTSEGQAYLGVWLGSAFSEE